MGTDAFRLREAAVSPHLRRTRQLRRFWRLPMLVLPLASAAAPPYAAASAAQSQPDIAADAFAQMKTLVGVWQVADRPTSPLRIRFYLTAGGTLLVESWERAGAPYSMTLYHRDGADLIATHYCPQGNQPRLSLRRSRRSGEFAFAFRDASHLDASREAYLIRLSFDLSDPVHPVRRESYREKGKDAASELTLTRVTGESTTKQRRRT